MSPAKKPDGTPASGAERKPQARSTAAAKRSTPIRKPAKRPTAKGASARSAGPKIKIDTDGISRRIEDAYRAVPSIGELWRWYDIPYRFLSWLMSGWRRRIMPNAAREAVNLAINYLIPFNEHERHVKAPLRGPLDDFTVLPDEHVSVPSVWVVELFPPSEYAALEAAIDAQHWDRRRRLLQDRESNREMLARSRSGRGWSWWHLASVGQLGSGFWDPDGTREKLPVEFVGVELKAIQIGQALTAVAAHFQLTDEAARHLDQVWHASHEPALIRRRGTRPLAEDRMFAAFRATQEARIAVHHAARSWLASRCPGFFAARSEAQPLIDLILMDVCDPLAGKEPSRNDEYSFRALGLTEHGPFERVSVQLPKVALVPTDLTIAPAMTSQRTAALWGQRDAVVASLPDRAAYGSKDDRAVAFSFSDNVQGFLLTMAISELLSVAGSEYARLRDAARRGHRRFKTSALKGLRQTLLTLSMDITSVSRDLREYWDGQHRYVEEAEFTLNWSRHLQSRARRERWIQPPSESLNAQMKEQQESDLARLIAVDVDYRDVLATAAMLGASADSSRTGRLALVIALASLAVAIVALMVR